MDDGYDDSYGVRVGDVAGEMVGCEVRIYGKVVYGAVIYGVVIQKVVAGYGDVISGSGDGDIGLGVNVIVLGVETGENVSLLLTFAIIYGYVTVSVPTLVGTYIISNPDTSLFPVSILVVPVGVVIGNTSISQFTLLDVGRVNIYGEILIYVGTLVGVIQMGDSIGVITVTG